MSNLAKLDYLPLAIAAPEILSVGLLRERSTKNSVAERSALSLVSQSPSAKLRLPEAIALLLSLTRLLRLVLLRGSPLALQHAAQ